MKTKTLAVRNSVNYSVLQRALLLIPLALVCLALLPTVHAVTPAPDGAYPGFNTAEGTNALFSLTTGIWNTAIGAHALYSNTTGSRNNAIGVSALLNHKTNSYNNAVGALALANDTSGNANNAFGDQALINNAIGSYNTGIGDDALLLNTSGSSNTVIGAQGLLRNTTGSNNTALGRGAGGNLTTGNNNIDIANGGVAGESNTIRIGLVQTRTFIAGIRGRTTANANAIPVVIDSAGQLGTASSSRRFKNEIRPMDKASEAILGLKPVTFHYKDDRTGTPQFGLIAEEVAQVNPDLVVRDENGEIYTVRYDAVNAMLLNEFLKEHRKVQEQEVRITQLNSTVEKQEATIAQQQKDSQSTAAEQQREIQTLAATVKEQASQIQKVSAQIELQKSPTQTVLNNQ
jgi:hypothetical protein